ncbi:lipopolysaccharide biosynthesis protein, partial [Pseudoalteromonas sp. SG45-6]
GTSLLGIFVANFDKVFLLIKGGSIDFGIYIVAFNTSRLIGIIPQTLSNVIFGKYAGANEEGLAKTTSRVFSLIFLPMLLLGILAAIVGELFIPIIFGEQYVSSILPFQILIFECIISGMGWILAQRFTAAGKPGLILIRQLFSILPFLLLFVYLPPFEISVILACSMLLASSLRLVITLFIYPKVFNEARPSFIADKKDYSFIYKTFLGK